MHPTASCLCGTVEFRITGPILEFQYCHCSRCRKFTGSAHAANLFVRPDNLEWTSGSEAIGRYSLDAKPGFHTAFCTKCGCSLPSMSSSGKFWVVPAGAFDDDPGGRPSRSIFWESRAAWYCEVSSLEKHAELPQK